MRLYGIDAPEMPGSCRPGRACTPGDPYAARDYLRVLTGGRDVRCDQRDIDDYGRRVVRCTADGADIGCAMVAAGHAVERYARLDCPAAAVRPALAGQDQRGIDAPRPVLADAPVLAEAPVPDAGSTLAGDPNIASPAVTKRYFAADAGSPQGFDMPWRGLIFWLVLVNIAAFAAFAVDKNRALVAAFRSVKRIPEALLLLLAAFGGSLGAVVGQQSLRHKTRKQPFATRLLLITGVQIGAMLGILGLVLWPPN